jgi:hypothetical protein
MNRRGFLKLGSMALAGAAVAPKLPVVAKLVIESTATGPVPVVFGQMRATGRTIFKAPATSNVAFCFYDLRGPVD